MANIMPPQIHPSMGATPDWSERFWAKVEVTESCWRWTASDSDGYGQFNRSGWGTSRAHRIAYLWTNGPIAPGLVLDHLCRNTRCVRPSHLEPVTDRTNILRGFGKPAQNARATHCIAGHELAGENLVPCYLERGERQCRTCVNARAKARHYTQPSKSPTAAECSGCGVLRHVRANGLVQKHREAGGNVCPGAGQRPVREAGVA